MPRFLIERNFAEALEVTKEDADQVRQINDEEGVKWLFSFLSPDKRKTYCSMRPRMRGDPHRRPKSEHTGRRGHRGVRAETRDVRLTNPRADRRQGGGSAPGARLALVRTDSPAEEARLPRGAASMSISRG